MCCNNDTPCPYFWGLADPLNLSANRIFCYHCSSQESNLIPFRGSRHADPTGSTGELLPHISDGVQSHLLSTTVVHIIFRARIDHSQPPYPFTNNTTVVIDPEVSPSITCLLKGEYAHEWYLIALHDILYHTWLCLSTTFWKYFYGRGKWTWTTLLLTAHRLAGGCAAFALYPLWIYYNTICDFCQLLFWNFSNIVKRFITCVFSPTFLS